jgi:hypothetical protein
MLDERSRPLSDGDVEALEQLLLVGDAVVARGSRRVRTPRQREQCLVEVDVAVDQRRQKKLSVSVEQRRQVRRSRSPRDNRADRPAL